MIGVGTTLAYDGPLQIGSLSLWLRASRMDDVDAVALMFKQSLEGSSREQAPPRAGEIAIVDEDHSADAASVPADGLLVVKTDGGMTVRSELMAMSIDGPPGSLRIRIVVRRRVADPLVFRVHLSIMLHRALLSFECAHLHAAAVVLGGAAFVFVGEKGAGKSSISTSLGRQGATILSDDHVLLRAASQRYLVSGCETRARIAADTEASVFARPLAQAPADFAGTLKKEFVVADFFKSAPHVDVPIAALCFPRVGARLAATPRSARAVTLDLLERTRRSYRPQDPGEARTLLDFWAGLAESVPAFDLELSPDLRELAQLADLLGRCLVPC